MKSFLKTISLLVAVSIILYANETIKPLDLDTYGKTYPIKEKDWWKLLQEKYKEYIKDNNISKRMDEIVKKSYYVDENIPLCKKDRTYSKELIYTVPNDIVWQGVTIYKKGYKFNLLRKMPLNGYIIVTNYDTKKEKEQLLNLIKQNKMQLRIYLTKGNVKEFEEDIETYFPNRYNIIAGKLPLLLKKRFEIKCVPTIIYQKNYALIVNEIGAGNGKKE